MRGVSWARGWELVCPAAASMGAAVGQRQANWRPRWTLTASPMDYRPLTHQDMRSSGALTMSARCPCRDASWRGVSEGRREIRRRHFFNWACNVAKSGEVNPGGPGLGGPTTARVSQRSSRGCAAQAGEARRLGRDGRGQPWNDHCGVRIAWQGKRGECCASVAAAVARLPPGMVLPRVHGHCQGSSVDHPLHMGCGSAQLCSVLQF